jgi:hypothetical protein
MGRSLGRRLCDMLKEIRTDYRLAPHKNDKSGLDNVGVRVPAGAGNFSLHHRVQTCSGDHPASYPMGTRGFFHRGKSDRGVTLTTHLHLVPRSRMRGAVTPLTNTPSRRGAQLKAQGQLYFYLIRTTCPVHLSILDAR